MMWLELSKWRGACQHVSQLAIAVALSTAACSSSPDDNAALAGGTGGGVALGSGGAVSPMLPTGTGGKPAGVAGMTAPGTGGKAAVVMPGTGGVTGSGGATGSGGMTAMNVDSGVPPMMNNGESACLDGITDYNMQGPFTFKESMEGQVNILVPDVPPGCKVPIVHLANGTTATCSAYQPSLERLASHGFLTVCYEDPNTGAGDQGVMAFDTAMMKYPDLYTKALGSTGHSQGGQAAFTVLALAEQKYGTDYIYAGLAMEPASGFGTQPSGTSWGALYATIKSPMFMFSAVGTDGLVSQTWVMDAYNAMNPATEVYFWTANGATHIPVPNGEEQEISVPWFRWKLLGDNEACKYFKSIPMTNTKWAEAASQNAKPCL